MSSEEYEESGCHPQGEVELMVESCTALLSSMFGENNWARWNQVKQQTQYYNDFQAFLSWLLDIAESEIIMTTNSEAAEAQARNGASDRREPDQENSVGCDEDAGAGTGSAVFPHHSTVGKGDPVPARVPIHVHQQHHPPQYGGAAVSDYDDVATRGLASDGRSHVTPAAGPRNFHSSHLSSYYESDFCAGGSVRSELTVEVSYTKDTKSFYCGSCGVSLGDIEMLRDHLALHHRGSPTNFTCTCCANAFNQLNDFISFHACSNSKRAGRAQSGAGRAPSPYVCGFCAKTFTQKPNLQYHVRNIHEKGEPKFSCPFCEKKFRYSASLYQHKKRCKMMVPAAVMPADHSIAVTSPPQATTV